MRECCPHQGFSTRHGVHGFAELLQSGLRVQLFKNRQVFNAVKRPLGDRVFSEVDVKAMLDPPTHLFLSLSLMTSPVLDLSGADLFVDFPVACFDALMHDPDVTGPGGHLNAA